MSSSFASRRRFFAGLVAVGLVPGASLFAGLAVAEERVLGPRQPNNYSFGTSQTGNFARAPGAGQSTQPASGARQVARSRPAGAPGSGRAPTRPRVTDTDQWDNQTVTAPRRASGTPAR